MEKVGAYKIVTSMFEAEFEAKVNELIRDGWQPQGNATCNDLRFMQAMVKEDPDDKKQKKIAA